jgi:NAD(P)-dependent dehydrogenase (short-subunit alcohol dehydrogenase family)
LIFTICRHQRNHDPLSPSISAVTETIVQTHAAISEFGRLDIVVTNAGSQMSHEKIEQISPEELDYTFRTNVFGTFLLIQTALKKLPPGGSDPEYNVDSSLTIQVRSLLPTLQRKQRS